MSQPKRDAEVDIQTMIRNEEPELPEDMLPRPAKATNPPGLQPRRPAEEDATGIVAPPSTRTPVPASSPSSMATLPPQRPDSRSRLPPVAPSIPPVASAPRSGGSGVTPNPQLRPPVRGSPSPPPTQPPSSGTGSGSGSGAGRHTAPEALGGAMPEPAPGDRLHHYEIIRLLGRGGMGSVYLARDTRLGRKVAIKFLRTHSSDLTKRFILEARTTAACSHENIVVIFEVDAWQGSPFMVFEYLQGQTLTKLIPEGRPLPAQRAVELMMPVVKALAFAHSQGIVHRDLKPDNILVTDSGLTKVLDFGIAKVLQGDEQAGEAASRPRAPKSSLEDSDDQDLTQQGAMMGTLRFMAPEQWGIGVPIDHRADIWAVGIMLYMMLSGKHPLEPLTGHQLMVTGLLKEPMPTLRSKAPEVPVELAQVVDRCLLKLKDQRWPDAQSLLRALEPFARGRALKDVKVDESPYAGLSSFQENDADRFFGRRLEVAALANRLQDVPVAGIVGPSGAGKSSFVRAGLVPALKRSGKWEALVLRPGRSPSAALTTLLTPLLSTSATVADDVNEQRKLQQRILAEPGYVGAVLRARARKERTQLLVFVDQFEELYTLGAEPKERLAFTQALAGVADDVTSPMRLVISIRSDFLDRVAEDPAFLAELSRGLMFLTTPGPEGLREAIVQPAEQLGYSFESPQIVEDMLGHLAATPGALPLLQFCAQKLWEQRDASKRRLTTAAYQSIGGVAGALAAHADAVLGRLPPASVALVRSIFLRLVTPDRTRAIVSVEELRELTRQPQEVQKLVDELVAARLLVVQTGSGQATVEIVHESLLHTWPTLKRWLEESGEDAAFLDQLRQAARQWQQKGRSADLLWRGEAAAEAMRFQRRYRGDLAQTEKRFLDEVVALDAREARRRRSLAVGAVVFLSILVAASFVALIVIQGARQEADRQAAAAKVAEAEAKDNLQKAQQKEKERAAAAAAAEAAAQEAQKANAELTSKQQELLAALQKAEEAAEVAREATGRAQQSASAAQDARTRAEEAKARADRARKDVADLLAKEQERAKRLEDQLGSPVIDTLK